MPKIKSPVKFIVFVAVVATIPWLFNACSSSFRAVAGNGSSSSGGTGQVDMGSSLPSAVFTCDDPNARSQSLSYTLTKTQYQNTVADLFGGAVLTAVSAQLSVLAPDTFDSVTNTRLTGITSPRFESYFNLAKGIAAWVTADKTRTTNVFGACATVASPTTACIDTYLNGFAKKILRRPLTSDEMSFARQIANRGGTYSANLATVLTLHLTSPTFLWQLETGTNGSDNLIKLTPYEVATRISYQTTDSTPDDTLLAAATAGQLSTVAQVQMQVTRLLQTTHGKEKVRRNILHWSRQDSVNSLSSLPLELTSGIQMSGLGQAMLDEANAYVDYEVYGQNASFRTLLTSKTSLASHAGLAAIYGHAPATATAPGTFSGRRQGLLMRAPLLTSDVPRASSIHRGVNFEKYILCHEIPLPDPTIVSIRNAHVYSDTEIVNHTTRDAITYQTNNAVCLACHGTINPAGFAFENFDPLGRLRTQEMIFNTSNMFVQNLAIDSASQVPLPDGSLQGVQDAYDLVTYVATSPAGSSCFVRNAQRYIFQGRETTQDGCKLQNVQNVVVDPNRPILDGMKELIGNATIFDKQK